VIHGVALRLLLYVLLLGAVLYAASFLPWQNLAGPWSGF
jgi:hypothetical protein